MILIKLLTARLHLGVNSGTNSNDSGQLLSTKPNKDSFATKTAAIRGACHPISYAVNGKNKKSRVLPPCFFCHLAARDNATVPNRY